VSTSAAPAASRPAPIHATLKPCRRPELGAARIGGGEGLDTRPHLGAQALDPGPDDELRDETRGRRDERQREPGARVRRRAGAEQRGKRAGDDAADEDHRQHAPDDGAGEGAAGQHGEGRRRDHRRDEQCGADPGGEDGGGAEEADGRHGRRAWSDLSRRGRAPRR
jgi:hypothetical protein